MGATSELIPIGELARRAAVSVKTLRYYSDIGIVPPATRTASGYRLYGEQERLRLETVKTLRSLGFGLEEIAAALEQRRDLRSAIAMQLTAVESRIRDLQRVAVVLRAALRGDGEPTSAHVARLEALSRLQAAERTALLDDFLGDVAGDTYRAGPWARWWSGFREASLPELPDEPTPDQLDAWLELAELLDDREFRERIRGMVEQAREPAGQQGHAELYELFDAALRAEADGITPEDPRAAPLVDRFVDTYRDNVGAGPDLARRTLEHIDRHDDPRMRRYWELVGRIRGWEGQWPQARAFDWLLAGLRARVGQTTGT